MKHCTEANVAMSPQAQSERQWKGHYPDLHNLPKPRWRDALKALAAPATRVHQYRNLHKAMFYEAVCQIDCKDRK